MKPRILYLFTRTPLHVGAGSSIGVVDKPIQREAHTGFPIIPGSSVKGVLRDHLGGLGSEALNEWFGQGGAGAEFRAGAVSFGEARLLLFPIRSAKGSFALATSPVALLRYARDAGLDLPVPSVADGECLAGDALTITRPNARGVVLEEYRFTVKGGFPDAWKTCLTSLFDDPVLCGSGDRLVILSDGELSHFTRTCCQIQQHVRIDDDTGTADPGGLFNEETVPSETFFYAPMVQMRGAGPNPVFKSLEPAQLIQFGGNGTTGLGFCTAKLGK